MEKQMDRQELIDAWKAEEAIAHIHGWDFSHVKGRVVEAPLPWDYQQEILRHLKPEMRILDIDTGGGEFLLRLRHPYENTAATENYLPNVELCRERLKPLGIDVRQADGCGALPFDDAGFDLVLNRHGDLNPEEIYRVLKPGGRFITQQVGAENDRELVELLCGQTEMPFPEQYLHVIAERFARAGFEIMDARECFRPIRFYDVGALVWFARIIAWEFPGFRVDDCLDRLFAAHEALTNGAEITCSAHRIFLSAQKPAV